MVDATTTYLGLTLPTVGADSNTWGGLINADLTSLDALWAAIGNVAFGTAATKTVGTATGNLLALSGTNTVTVNVTGNVSGSSGSCTGNAASATTVSNGAITPAKMSTGAPSWDTSGNTTVTGSLIAGTGVSATGSVVATEELQANSGDMRMRVSGSSRNFDFSVSGNHRWQFNDSTGTLALVVNNVPVWSCDISGNMIAKGTITPSGTPAT